MKKWQILLAVTVIFSLIIMFGCQPKQKPINPDLLSNGAKEQIIKYRDRLKYIHETDWLATLFIVGGAASVFMLVRGMATGFPLLVASTGGLIALRLDQSLAEQTWPYFVMGLLLLGGFLWYFYVTFIDKQAFREVVAGGERLKKGFPFAAAAFRVTQTGKDDGGIQSKSTQKLIKKVKEKNK